MTIRELEWRDFEPLTEAYWALYEEVKEDPDLGISLFPTKPTAGDEAEWFAKLYRGMKDGSAVASVAEEAGLAVGLCSVQPSSTLVEGAHVGHLGISIARPWRGRGIGRALMSDALTRSEGKFELVTLSVFATNRRAIALYESLGFRTWGTHPRAVRREGRYTDVLHMQRELSRAPAGPPGRSASDD